MKTANSITLNRKNRTIEVTKKFYAAASKYNSEEEPLLRFAQNNPGFKVVVATRKTKSTYKGLDYEYMTAYIKAHDDENKHCQSS